MHNFVESDPRHVHYRIIFCTWCGKVAWHFNAPDLSKTELQKNCDEPCVRAESRKTVEA